MVLDDYTGKKKEIEALCGKIYFQNQLRADKLQVEKNFPLIWSLF